MLINSFSPIAKRLIIFIVGIGTCFSLVITLIQIGFDYRAGFSVLESSLKNLERVSNKSLGTAIWYLDSVQIETILSGIKNTPGIEKVVLETATTDDVKNVIGTLNARSILEKSYQIFYQIDGENRHVGDLKIYISLDQLYETLLVKFGIGLLGNIIKTLTVSFLLLVFIKKSITSRLDKLGRYASEVALEDHADAVEVERNEVAHYKDEISVVYEQIYTMEKRLKESYRQRREQNLNYQKKLKNEIKEKTKELLANQSDLVEASRRAGMAEVAIGFLHNIGNIMTSMIVNCDTAAKSIDNSQYQARSQDFFNLLADKVPEIERYLASSEGEKAKTYWKTLNEFESTEINNRSQAIRRINDGLKDIEEIIKLQMNLTKAPDFKQKCEVDKLIERAIEVNRVEMEKNLIELRQSIETNFTVETIPSKLVQILVNLILNAIQAFPDGQKKRVIEISARETDFEIIISCKDNGVGISEGILVKIFSFGFTTKAQGSGFGLHSSSLMAADLGGKLVAKSDGLGHGAEFVLSIPKHI